MEIHAVERHRESEPQVVLADHVLLDQFVNEGSQDAFARLMNRYGPYVFGVCKRVTFHVQDAEDVFQACFLELARRASSLRQHGSVAAWLQVVAVRLGRRARARAARRQQVEARLRLGSPIRDPGPSDQRSLPASHSLLPKSDPCRRDEVARLLTLCNNQGRIPEAATIHDSLCCGPLRAECKAGPVLRREGLSSRARPIHFARAWATTALLRALMPQRHPAQQ